MVDQLVKQCINDKVRSNKRILEKIAQNKSPQITFAQLKNLKARIKVSKYGKSDNTLTELIEWANNNLQVPDDDDKVFCGGIDYAIDDMDEIDALRIFYNQGQKYSI